MVTFSARTITKPWMSRLASTVPSLVTVMSPLCRVSVLPALTPVVAALGLPDVGLVAALLAVADPDM